MFLIQPVRAVVYDGRTEEARNGLFHMAPTSLGL